MTGLEGAARMARSGGVGAAALLLATRELQTARPQQIRAVVCVVFLVLLVFCAVLLLKDVRKLRPAKQADELPGTCQGERGKQRRLEEGHVARAPSTRRSTARSSTAASCRSCRASRSCEGRRGAAAAGRGVGVQTRTESTVTAARKRGPCACCVRADGARRLEGGGGAAR